MNRSTFRNISGQKTLDRITPYVTDSLQRSFLAQRLVDVVQILHVFVDVLVFGGLIVGLQQVSRRLKEEHRVLSLVRAARRELGLQSGNSCRKQKAVAAQALP